MTRSTREPRGSLTRPLSDPDEELAEARHELARAESRLARHLARPGGPHPHTYRWLDIARRRVTAAEGRTFGPSTPSSRRPAAPPSDSSAEFWAAFTVYANEAGFPGGYNHGTSLRHREGLVAWGLRVRDHDGEAEMLIEYGTSAENAALFDRMSVRKSQVEGRIGTPLVWDRVGSRRRQRIATRTRDGGCDDASESWPDIWDHLLRDMAELERALRPALVQHGVSDSWMPAGGLRVRPRIEPLGVAYRPADETPPTGTRDPFLVDPNERDRATLGHWRTQNLLAQALLTAGMEPLRPIPVQPDYDLAWEHDGVWFVAEVKSLRPASESRQLRLGLGQVLDYQDTLLAHHPDVRAVLMVEREPSDERWTALCQRHDVVLLWPGIVEAFLESISAPLET